MSNYVLKTDKYGFVDYILKTETGAVNGIMKLHTARKRLGETAERTDEFPDCPLTADNVYFFSGHIRRTRRKTV